MHAPINASVATTKAPAMEVMMLQDRQLEGPPSQRQELRRCIEQLKSPRVRKQAVQACICSKALGQGDMSGLSRAPCKSSC